MDEVIGKIERLCDMSDLISRSSLLDSMIHCDGLGRKSMEAVLKVINEQPPIEAVPVVHDSWIPVSERLPEEDMEVIVTDSSGRVLTDYFWGYAEDYDEEPCFHKWDSEFWNCYKPDVIAWQPLPEPYSADMREKVEE